MKYTEDVPIFKMCILCTMQGMELQLLPIVLLSLTNILNAKMFPII